MKKVSELTGSDLALWVARAEEIETPGGRSLYSSVGCLYVESGYGGGEPFPYRPDSRWQHGGSIIERERITIFEKGEWWAASMTISPSTRLCDVRGDTHLEAAMRCYVASVYGETVDA